MLFNVEHDYGDRIVGYVVPDAFTETPSIRLSGGERELLTISANELREALVVAGRHGSGLCGFDIGPDLVPELAGIADLRIQDVETGINIYRRPLPNQINRKLVRIETHLFPLWKFDNSFKYIFQYFEKSLERHGRETVTQMFLLNDIQSVYLSGRIQYRNYSYYIEGGFEIICLIQDPYYEFSERLLTLARMKEIGAEHLGLRDATRFAPAIDFAAALPFDDPKALRRALIDMPIEVGSLFVDPVVRQLTTSTPDEMPTGGAVAAALDVLSDCLLVGKREDPELFNQTIGALLNIDPYSLPALPNFPRVAALAESIRTMRAIDHLIERDLELHAQVSTALNNIEGMG